MSVQVKLKRETFAQRFAAIVCVFWPVAIYAASGKPADDAAQSTAICPIVYPVDQSEDDVEAARAALKAASADS
jgi:hypothetical protein